MSNDFNNHNHFTDISNTSNNFKKLLFKKIIIISILYININNWILPFMIHRKQQVIVEGESSKLCSVDSGIPQGTAIGPLVFLCHINDFHQRATSKLDRSQIIVYCTDQ